MYQPQYQITNSILKNIGRVEAAREVVENAPLIPAYTMKFRSEALNRTIHYGTHLEGNNLNFSQAVKVLEGKEVVARERDVQEIINYRRVMRFIDELASLRQQKKDTRKGWLFTQKMLKRVHELTCDRIIPEESRGVYRTTQVVLRNTRTGEVFFRPPPAIEVEYLMEDFFEWLNSKPAAQIHPVIRAGIVHYGLVAIHSFIEGNGRSSRAFATLVLFGDGYDIKRFFSMEEYFDQDAASYYQALFSVSSQSKNLGERDLTPWLEYFTEVLGVELDKVKQRVRNISFDARVKGRLGAQ
ncbi:Fic family protein, partial [Patescibacteria group bacterium]|nr:Fic family protein [Patescibacteria group bacterium]